MKARGLLAAGMIGLAACAGARGQEPSAPQAPPTMASMGLAPINVDFKGGSLAQYVDVLTAAARGEAKDAPVNIVLADPKLGQYVVPSVQLRRVTLETALRAAIYPRSRLSADDVLNMEQIGAQMGQMGSQVFVISAGPGRGKPRTQRVEIFDVRDLTRSGTKIETILTAVETALHMEDAGEAEIKYHDESGLVIIRATAGQLEAAGQVVGHLTDGAREGDAERAVKERRVKLEQARNELDRRSEELSHMRAEHAAAVRKQDEAARAHAAADDSTRQDLRKRLDEAHAHVSSTTMMTERVERQVRALENLVQQLQLADYETGRPTNSEVTRLRAENAQLRARIEELEKKVGAR